MKTKGIYFLYRVLQALALPLLPLYFALREYRHPGYWRSLSQRLGFLPRRYRQTTAGAIWLHAVSVGEILGCVEFLKLLRRDFPRTPLFVSTTTPAGFQTAGSKLNGIADGVFYAPLDFVFAVRRVLRTLRPAVVLIAETEIWPNLFREVRRTDAGLAIVNGRISDRAFPRDLRLRPLFAAVLPAADIILTQSDEHRDRFLALGAPPERVQTGGNFKYDFEPQPTDLKIPGRIWIAASTMPPAAADDVDEDDSVIAAHRELTVRFPDLRLVLAPRKPERFDLAARKLEAAGLSYARRTQGDAPASVLLLDTIGELAGIFALADVVFMGGTLARRGGHNILEPAFFAKPVIVGPHMQNFQTIIDEFRAARACVEIPDASSLASAVAHLLESPDEAHEISARARACAEARKGASARAAAEVQHLYRIPKWRPAQPWFEVAWLLSRLWRWGGARRQPAPRKLDVPVICAGNLTMGGTGKTPCVLLLAEELRGRGRAPAILTRGHGRRSLESTLVLHPGELAPVEQSGDEPQIFLRSGLAPVGIGGDRWKVAKLLLREFDVSCFLLDDGFQHRRLARDVDIVLIDALNPFGGGELFPLGRLREPVEGLARADILLITRADLTDAVPAVERALRVWNPSAPVFRARVEPQSWVEHRTGRNFPVGERPFRRAGAFCGLGNPESFRRTLAGIGVVPVDWVVFGDHHRYAPSELSRLSHQIAAAGAEALVTTEKDTINMCESCDDLLAPLPLYWLKVRMAVDNEKEFFAEIERRLQMTRPR